MRVNTRLAFAKEIGFSAGDAGCTGTSGPTAISSGGLRMSRRTSARGGTMIKRCLRWILTRLQGGKQPDAANLLGWVIYFTDSPSPGLVYHEEIVHPRQRARDGWLRYHWRYLCQLVTVGYARIDYEVEARAEQDRINRGDGS